MIGINSREIKYMQPVLIRGYHELVRRAKELRPNIQIGVSSTYRSAEYQDWLFASGRTRPGNIVTNARGGFSSHNWGLAFDVFQNIRGREWEVDFFNFLGPIWRDMGGVWGGDWISFIDRPHFEFTNGLRTSLDTMHQQNFDNWTMQWEADFDSNNLTYDNTKYITEKEINKMRFNTLEEIEEMAPWALNAIQYFINNEHIRSDLNALDLSWDTIRVLTIIYRALEGKTNG